MQPKMAPTKSCSTLSSKAQALVWPIKDGLTPLKLAQGKRGESEAVGINGSDGSSARKYRSVDQEILASAGTPQ
jgi:hypothetical protein